MAETYLAVVCRQLGAPAGLGIERLDRQPCGPEEVRVRVRAAGVHFPDLLMVQGLYQYKPPLPFVPGMEAAGEILEAPLGSGLATNERVIVHVRSGAWAEEVIAPAAHVIRLPVNYGFVEGAAFYASGITAYHALATRAHLEAGQDLLVLGAGGGVGLAAVRIGAILGAKVIAAASSPAKLAAAAQHGAAELINYGTTRIEDRVRQLTQGEGVDVVFDPIGLAWEQALRCVRWGGRILVVGFAGGTIPSYPANRVLLKGISVLGLRAGEFGRRFPGLRTLELQALLALATGGQFKPLVPRTHPLRDFALALELLANRDVVGRLVLLT